MTALSPPFPSLPPKYQLGIRRMKDLLVGSCRVWLCGLRLRDGVSGGGGSRMGLRHSLLPLRLFQAFTTVATLNPMRLSVVLLPFAVKGLAMSRSASERFKVSCQRPGHTALRSACSLAFIPTIDLLNVTPGQGRIQPGWRGTL